MKYYKSMDIDIDYNTSCYNFKELHFQKGLLDESVDCTYIIHLEDNGRIEHIYSEINKYPITKKVVIVFNKGFKKCNKKLVEQISYQDLTDAFLQCLKNAKQNNYKNILILEDDFIFDPKIKESFHTNKINNFIKSKQNEAFIYYIGVIPILIYPTTDLYTYNAVRTLTMHSVIYSEKVIQNYDKLDLKYKHWDVIVDKNLTNKYLYYSPLCYQTFPETENKKSWSEKDGSPFMDIAKNVFIKLFQMDKHAELGFNFFYIFSKILSFLIVIILLFISVKVVNIVKNKIVFRKSRK